MDSDGEMISIDMIRNDGNTIHIVVNKFPVERKKIRMGQVLDKS